MSVISLFEYPVLDENLFQKLGFTLEETRFSYQNENGTYPLTASSEEGATTKNSVFSVQDLQGVWNLNTS